MVLQGGGGCPRRGVCEVQWGKTHTCRQLNEHEPRPSGRDHLERAPYGRTHRPRGLVGSGAAVGYLGKQPWGHKESLPGPTTELLPAPEDNSEFQLQF